MVAIMSRCESTRVVSRIGAVVARSVTESRSCGGRPVLRDLCLDIHSGTKVGVAGRNGAGKTSLLHLITGDLHADAGSVAHYPTQIVKQLEMGPVAEYLILHLQVLLGSDRLANLPRTSVQTLEAACQAGRDAGLRYVYTSNIAPHEGCNTVCARCGTTVIERLAFKVLSNDLRRGVCPKCRKKLPGVWR